MKDYNEEKENQNGIDLNAWLAFVLAATNKSDEEENDYQERVKREK